MSRVDVAEDRPGAGGRDGLGRGVEGERGDDDVVARADAQRAQRDGQRLGAVGDPDDVVDAQEGGELLLEGRDLGPEDVLAAIEHLVDGLAQAAAQAGQRGGGIEEGDAHAGQPTEASGRQAAWAAGRAASRMPSSAGVAALAPASRTWPAQASCSGT